MQRKNEAMNKPDKSDKQTKNGLQNTWKPASRKETWEALSPDAKKLMEHLNKKFGIEFLHGSIRRLQ